MIGFEKYNNIQFHDLSHLYWGKYPYKVLVPFQEPLTRWQNKRKEEELRLEKLTKFPPGNVPHRFVKTSSGFNFFFEELTDTIDFIDNNPQSSQVWRPHSEEAVDRLSDAKVRIRGTLFWGKYRWCMTFKCPDITDEEHIDEWVSEHFEGSEDDRIYYVFSSPRKLYLNSEIDVLTVKVGAGEFVKSVEYAVLTSENLT